MKTNKFNKLMHNYQFGLLDKEQEMIKQVVRSLSARTGFINQYWGTKPSYFSKTSGFFLKNQGFCIF